MVAFKGDEESSSLYAAIGSEQEPYSIMWNKQKKTVWLSIYKFRVALDVETLQDLAGNGELEMMECHDLQPPWKVYISYACLKKTQTIAPNVLEIVEDKLKQMLPEWTEWAS